MIEVAFEIFFVRYFGLSSSFSILSVHPYFLVHMRPRISTGPLAARKDYKNRPTVENRRKWSKIVEDGDLSWDNHEGRDSHQMLKHVFKTV